MGAHPLFGALSQQWLDPIKLVYIPSRPDVLTASAFNQLGQYANMATCMMIKNYITAKLNKTQDITQFITNHNWLRHHSENELCNKNNWNFMQQKLQLIKI